MAPDKLQTIEVTYNPPPDGSYPPRFLTSIPGRETIWLPERDLVWIVPNELAALRDGDVYSLIPNTPRTSSVRKQNKIESKFWVNGEPLLYNYVLQDGDFIHKDKQTRIIFQVDAVADRKRRLSLTPGSTTTLELPEKIYKKVMITPEGLSFAHKNHFVEWDHIICLHIYNRKRPLIVAYKRGKVRTLKSNLYSLSAKEIQALGAWFQIALPFDLSIKAVYGSGLYPHLNYDEYILYIFDSAYICAVREKIIMPAEARKRQLPLSEKVLLEIPPPHDRFKSYLEAIAIATGITICVGIVLFSGIIETILSSRLAVTIIQWAIFLVAFLVTGSYIGIIFYMIGKAVIQHIMALKQKK